MNTFKRFTTNKNNSYVVTFQNTRNEHKYIEVKVGKDGHTYSRQYMLWNTERGEVKNYIGSRKGRYFRSSRRSLTSILEDYIEVA